MTDPPFSLLLPVYQRDRPDFLRRAFTSTVQEQTLPPSDVVIVRDGPVSSALQRCLEQLSETSAVPVNLVLLPRHSGLAVALESGLAACRHDVVARMDADDVSLPHRFAVQLPLLRAGADLVGAGLAEFSGDERCVRAVRVPPVTPEEIAARARFHSPFNHPTVVYRRSVVLRVGGYRELPMLEDYWLFARMIEAGARVANVAEPLLLYRVDSGSYDRRGGWRLFRSEMALQRHLLDEAFLTRRQFVRNVIVRGGYRFVPIAVRRAAYRRVFTHRNAAGAPT